MNINEKISELRAEIEAKNKQIADKQAELDQIKKMRNDMAVALACTLREKYGSFIGRVVQVSWKGFYGENREAEGILAREAFTTRGENVLPILYKIKKNGAASKNRVPEWGLPRVDESFTIKLKQYD